MTPAQVKTDYTAIDAAILACVSGGPDQPSPLYSRTVIAEAAAIAQSTGRIMMRVIDGRLKCLRNAGKIVYQSGKGAGWRIAMTDTPKPPQAAQPATAAENGGETGSQPGLLQDDSRKLTDWLASKPDARLHAREAAAAIKQERAVEPEAPTLAQLNSACMSYRHDFGLMEDEERERLRWAAKEWLRAWRKEVAWAAHPSPPADTLAEAHGEPAHDDHPLRHWDRTCAACAVDAQGEREADLLLAIRQCLSQALQARWHESRSAVEDEFWLRFDNDRAILAANERKRS